MNSFNSSIKKGPPAQKDKLIKPEHILSPIIIQNKHCSQIDIPEGIEQAQRLCQNWNNLQTDKSSNLILKCHIHPYSCKERKEKHVFYQ